LVEIKMSQSNLYQLHCPFMNRQPFLQLSSYKMLLLSSIALSACISFSVVLMTLGWNESWMLNIHATPVFPTWFWALVNLGGDAWVILLVLLLIERFPGEITSWVLKTWLIGAVFAQLIKKLLPMPRPASVLGIENLSIIDHPPLVSGSMPSGHALAAISCALILCTVLKLRGAQNWHLLLIALTAGIVAWARVAVGAHWPSDVIAGAGLAFAVVAISLAWERRNSWNAWFQSFPGGIFLIALHILISWHLVTPQSDFIFVQFVQFNLACVSLLRALYLVKKYWPIRSQ
jgi:membrane-associated phospholipid phosphatase